MQGDSRKLLQKRGERVGAESILGMVVVAVVAQGCYPQQGQWKYLSAHGWQRIGLLGIGDQRQKQRCQIYGTNFKLGLGITEPAETWAPTR